MFSKPCCGCAAAAAAIAKEQTTVDTSTKACSCSRSGCNKSLPNGPVKSIKGLVGYGSMIMSDHTKVIVYKIRKLQHSAMLKVKRTCSH